MPQLRVLETSLQVWTARALGLRHAILMRRGRTMLAVTCATKPSIVPSLHVSLTRAPPVLFLHIIHLTLVLGPEPSTGTSRRHPSALSSSG